MVRTLRAGSGAWGFACVAFVAAAAAGACNALTGVDEVEFGSGASPTGGVGTTGGGGTAGSGVATGSGGGGSGAVTGASSSAASSSSAGAGGGGNPRCPPDMGDCDLDPTTCETDLATDVDNCGSCGRACSSLHVASKSCVGGSCVPACEDGFADCVHLQAPVSDDGCETDATTELNCGGCGNDCPVGFECKASRDLPNGEPKWVCACVSNVSCGSPNGTCLQSGACDCGPVCSLGEKCMAFTQCTCDGGESCKGGLTCCSEPKGCVDLATDPGSCGACNHACPPGFACSGGQCICDEAEDCDAGTDGMFGCVPALGRCVCGNETCEPGGRCQADGHCG